MAFEFRPAVREGAPLLIGLVGGSGSGKTFSALRLARGLAGGAPFAVVDTENGRALHYADMFPEMQHGDLRAPFTPTRYVGALEAADAAGYPVVVVDSVSHEWDGDGGMLDMQVAEFKRLGARDSVKMLSWAGPKQEHKRMVQRLLQMRAHVILCMRAEDKIEMVKDAGGKTVIRPKESLAGLDGWVPVCERRLPFELTLSLLFSSADPGVPRAIKLQEQHRGLVGDGVLSEDAGVALAAWASGAGSTGSLVAELVGLGELRGAADAVRAAVESHRLKNAAVVHREWLSRQILKAKEVTA